MALTVIEPVFSLVAILGTTLLFTNAVGRIRVVRSRDPFFSSAYYRRGFCGEEEE
jgi:hypothetical protein